MKIHLCYFFLVVEIFLFASDSKAAKRKIFPGPGKPDDQAIVTYTHENVLDPADPDEARLICFGLKSKLMRLTGSQKNEQIFYDFQQKALIRLLQLNRLKTYSTLGSLENTNQGEETSDTLTVLGHLCKRFRFIHRRDTLSVWIWKQNGLKGSPEPSTLNEEGIVLKIEQRQHTQWLAKSIVFQKTGLKALQWPQKIEPLINAERYRQILRESEKIRINIFQKETLGFSEKERSASIDRSTQTYRYANGTVLLKKIKFPVQKQDYNLSAELTEYSSTDPKPRQGSIFIIPLGKKQTLLSAFEKGIKSLSVYKSKNGKSYRGFLCAKNFEPPIELIRFSTPFGGEPDLDDAEVQKRQKTDSVTWTQDIGFLKEALTKEVWIGVYISGIEPNEHTLSLSLTYYPSGPDLKKHKAAWIQPLFNTVNILGAMGQEPGTFFNEDSLSLTIKVPEGLKSLELRYMSTGHGSWPYGEAYQHRINELSWDDDELLRYVPWRGDCANFSVLNISSPILSNGVVKSDLSRAGWCPGALVESVIVPISDFDDGDHTLKLSIPFEKTDQKVDGYWNVSAVLVGHYD